MVRYKGIENYQTKGNMRFERQANGEWSMKYDPYQCRTEVEKVREAFFIAYQTAGVKAGFAQSGYSQTTTTEQKKVVVVGTKW